MTDLQARIAELHANGTGKGYRLIARELGITPHVARKEIEAIKARGNTAPQAPAGSMLQVYDSVCRLLAEATLINDVLPLLDQIAHVKLHARKVRDRRAVGQALALQQRAERKLGEIIVAARESEGHFTQGNRVKKSETALLPRATLAEVGVDKKLSTRAQKLAALDSPTFEEATRELEERIASGAAKLIDRETATKEKQERRASRERLAGIAMPQGKFGVIVEDYEWDHETWSDKGRDRAAENHYPVSKDAHTAQEIVDRTKDRFDCAADDCVLWMWTTIPHLAIALDVMRLRGFDYKSHYVWGKDKAGTGYWSRGKHEVLLIGVKGHIDCPAPGTQWDSLIMAPRGKHSAKPECFLEMIEGYFPTLPKIELNRRGAARKGWSCWGFDAQPMAAE